MNTLLILATVLHWTVDPMCETMYLPDREPADGEKGGTVQILAAKGEFEPGSFILRSDTDLGHVTLEIGELKNEKGIVFPKERLDLKTVKVWYQAGNAWFSYFADKGHKLCPELLLNDEDLVKVDTVKECNYARLTEKDGRVSYYWLGEPKAFHTRTADSEGFYCRIDDTFQCMKPNFRDAPKHCGVTLPKNVSKQFFLTAEVTKDTPAGLYRGTIQLKHSNTQTTQTLPAIPVALRVLDFELPPPMTYEDVNRPFLTRFCDYTSLPAIRDLNGDDPALAREQLLAICRDFARHGQDIPSFAYCQHHRDIVEEAGQVFSPWMSVAELPLTDYADIVAEGRRLRRWADREFGPGSRPVVSWGDEFGLASMHGIPTMVEHFQKLGFRFQINSRWAYPVAPFYGDIYWPPIDPSSRSADEAERIRQTSAGHTYLGWYASQHVGNENPGFVRRQYGFGPYRAGLTCNYNYAHHLAGWNDSVYDLYRPMMFVYGSGSGCIDTIQWEAFREGLDDIRYATLLKRLALPIVDSTDIEARYAARTALKLLAENKRDDRDLTTLRLEMIRHILVLRTFAK